jgi:hypothetical protein
MLLVSFRKEALGRCSAGRTSFELCREQVSGLNHV